MYERLAAKSPRFFHYVFPIVLSKKNVSLALSMLPGTGRLVKIKEHVKFRGLLYGNVCIFLMIAKVYCLWINSENGALVSINLH